MIFKDTTKNSFLCDKCGNQIEFIGDPFKLYFKEEYPKCNSCDNSYNYFREMNNNFSDFTMNPFLTNLLGVKMSIGSIEITEGIFSELDFTKLGVPENADIISVNYTPEGKSGIFPLEFHGNSPSYLRRYYDNKVGIFPIKLFEESEENNTKLNIFILWTHNASIASKNLIEAFIFHRENELEKFVIFANVAVEETLEKFLYNYLVKNDQIKVKKKKIKKFLEDSLSYYDQLNVLLPFLTGLSNSVYKPLNNEIIANLNYLRKLRNKMVHTGKLETPLSMEDGKPLLMSSLFMLIYLDYVSKDILQNN